MNKQTVFLFVLVFLFLVGCRPLATPPSPTSQTLTQTGSPISAPTNTNSTFSPTPVIDRPVDGGPTGTDGFPWWNDTVFYEIFVRTFYDSDGNGVGDFNGVTAKLDYLDTLGVKGIYLMMIMQDDITEQHPEWGVVPWRPSDYRAVYHEYGTMDDFKRLLSEAHRHGIRVIMDFVMHSTSIQHPWFLASKDPNSPYRNWYNWSDHDLGPTDWGTQAWFQTDSGYYLSVAGPDVALLNLNNPDVTDALYEVVQFWLDMGVDGFRLDDVKQLIPELPHFSNTQSTHDWLKQFRLFYKGVNPESMTFGEVWESDPGLLASYTHGDETDLATEYDLTWAIPRSVNDANNNDVVRALRDSSRFMSNQQFVTFISNHDLDRTMSKSPAYNGGVGVGIGENPQKAKVAASLYLTAPGMPIVYWGEEIGIRGIKLDAQGAWVCDNFRRVMQWSGDRIAAGFSTRYPPANSNIYTDEWDAIDVYNVAREMNDPNSILSHYRALIALRNTHPALRIGDLNIVTTSNPGLFASLRTASDEAVGVIINLTDASVFNAAFSLAKSRLPKGKYKAISLKGSFVDRIDPRLESSNDPQDLAIDLIVNENGGFSISLPPDKGIRPYGTLIFKLIKQ